MDEDFDFEQEAAKVVARDARMLYAEVDGGDIRVAIFAEPGADLTVPQRIHALTNLALAKLKQLDADLCLTCGHESVFHDGGTGSCGYINYGSIDCTCSGYQSSREVAAVRER